MILLAPISTLFPYTTLFRSRVLGRSGEWTRVELEGWVKSADLEIAPPGVLVGITAAELRTRDRKSTRLNSSHTVISYAVFCLKKKRSRITHGIVVHGGPASW